MRWWLDMMPLELLNGRSTVIKYQGKQRNLLPDSGNLKPDNTDEVMLRRPRKSRIYHLRKFFDYPLSLNGKTIVNLGPLRIARIALSYAWA